MALENRKNEANKWYNRFDPLYIVLDRVICRGLFVPQRKGNAIRIPESDELMILDNIKKHRWIAWVNAFSAVYMAFFGLDTILNVDDVDVSIIVTGLLAPAMVTGSAWFNVSFGGIPSTYIRSALLITSTMFLSFSLSITLLTVILIGIVHWAIAACILIPIYLALYIACILYDNTDGLKIGLDETQLKFSRAMINYHRKTGLVTELETRRIEFEGEVEDLSLEQNKINFLNNIISRLFANAEKLEQENSLQIANDLISESIYELYKTIGKEANVKEFNKSAFAFSQKEVDEESLQYLEFYVGELNQIGSIPQIDLGQSKEDLSKLNLLITFRAEKENSKEKQNLIDHQFAKTIYNLCKIIDQNMYEIIKKNLINVG